VEKYGYWAIGIDPGFGETGLVLLDPKNKVRAYATMKDAARGNADVLRARHLATRVAGMIANWFIQHELRDPVVCIELPVYTGNPVNFGKQIRLIQEIETRLHVYARRLIEVNPTQSKKLATGRGDATKPVVIAASPFHEDGGLLPKEARYATREALADAWAHAQAAWVPLEIIPLGKDIPFYGEEAIENDKDEETASGT
jgi:Holliday junction resolvasome RuvABC endonuclease subunit